MFHLVMIITQRAEIISFLIPYQPSLPFKNGG